VPLKILGTGNRKVNLWEDTPESDQAAEHLVEKQKTVRPSNTLQLKLVLSGRTMTIFAPAK